MHTMKPLFDGIKLNCTIVSDTHQDINHWNPELPQMLFINVLMEDKASEAPVDSLVIVGDTTSRGMRENWDLFRGCFTEKTEGYAKQLLLQLGNHDTWHDVSYNEAIGEYYSAVKDTCGFTLDHVYYSKEINGYRFIFLGSEEEGGCSANISDNQINWLDKEVELGTAAGKPVFIFNHQALNGTHGLPKTWDAEEDPNADPMEGGVGLASDKIRDVLCKYKNVFYFSGHSHMGLNGEKSLRDNGYSSFEYLNGALLVMLPSLACGNHHGEDLHFDIGYQLEVYADRVLLRPRNYAEHEWNSNVAIKDGKPYLEVMIS
jgi:Predicted phosphohydrolases